MLRRIALTSLLLLLCAALASAASPSPRATYASVLSGKTVPLTLKLKQLNRNWRAFSATGASEEGALSSAMYGLPGGYYTKGQTLTVGGETYLVAYAQEDKGGMLSMFIGRGGAKQEELSGNTVVRLALLNVRTMGSLGDIRPFDLKAENARRSKGYQALQSAVSAQASAAIGEGEASGAPDETAQNLKNMALAISMYVVDYDTFPPMSSPEQFRAAAEDYVSDQKVFKDPKQDEYFALNPALSGQQAPAEEKQAETMVAYQITPDEEGNRWVAFADGHVKQLSARDWETVKTKAGLT